MHRRLGLRLGLVGNRLDELSYRSVMSFRRFLLRRFLVTLLTDDINHDHPQVLHFFQAVCQFSFVLPLHFSEFVLEPPILLLRGNRVLLFSLQLFV